MYPHVILSCAMSIDGKIGKKGEQVLLSNRQDLDRVHNLRGNADAIMVGINTVITDNPQLTARQGGKNPVRVIVDSNARLPVKANVLTEPGEVILAVSNGASRDRLITLKKNHPGLKMVATGDRMVNLKNLLMNLYERGIKVVLLEGGGTLNHSMLEGGFINEMYITLVPVVLGEGIALFNGKAPVSAKPHLEGIIQHGDQVVLHYSVPR